MLSMIPELRKLSGTEMELVYNAPLLVSILIAGADGTIDKKEIRSAIVFTGKKMSGAISLVSSLLSDVSQDFEDKLKVLLRQYPKEADQRNSKLVEELGQLNSVLAKIDSKFATEYYTMLLSIAHRIANSSGGILGYKSIGEAEARYVKLDMIQDPSSS